MNTLRAPTAPFGWSRLPTASGICGFTFTGRRVTRAADGLSRITEILTGRRPRPVMQKSQLSANTEHWPLDRLGPYEYNARTHSSAPLEQIANSIRQCGFTCTGRRATRTADAVLFHRRTGGGAMMDRPMEVTSDPGPVYMPELRIHARVGPR